jgi:hypothetical protein
MDSRLSGFSKRFSIKRFSILEDSILCINFRVVKTCRFRQICRCRFRKFLCRIVVSKNVIHVDFKNVEKNLILLIIDGVTLFLFLLNKNSIYYK